MFGAKDIIDQRLWIDSITVVKSNSMIGVTLYKSFLNLFLQVVDAIQYFSPFQRYIPHSFFEQSCNNEDRPKLRHASSLSLSKAVRSKQRFGKSSAIGGFVA